MSAEKAVDFTVDRKKLKRNLDKRIDTAIAFSMKQTAAQVIGQAVRDAPVDTGDLQKSGSAKVMQQGDRYWIEFKFSQPYARRQNYEHKKAKHNGYLTKAIKKGKPYLNKRLKINLKKVLK